MYVRTREGLGRAVSTPRINLSRAIRENQRLAQNLSWQAHRRDIEHRLLGFTTPGTDTGFAQADRTHEIKKWAQCILPAARIDAKKAVELNRRTAGKYGWQAHRDRIMRLLGLTATPDEKGFAIAVAQWQCMQGLEPVDGIIGKNTWQRMRALIKLECPGYIPGEEARSRTIGYLHPAVIRLNGRRLLIADFGVNEAEFKIKGTKEEKLKEEKLLRDWRDTLETDPSYRLRILGHTDCIGKEKNNMDLRSKRADSVYQWLGKSAQSRVISKGPAPLGTYVADNITTIGRAKNRGVTIEFQTDQPVEKRPPDKKRLEPYQHLGPGQYQLVVRTFVPFKTFGLGFHGDNRGFSTSNSVTYRTGMFIVFDIRKGQIVQGPEGHSTGTYWPFDPFTRMTGRIDRAWAKVNARIKEQEAAPYRIRFHTAMAGNMPLIPGTPNINTDIHFTAFLKDRRLFLAGRGVGESFPNTEVFIRDSKRVAHSLLQYKTKGGPLAPLYVLFGTGTEDLGSFKEAIQLDEEGNFVGSAIWNP